MRLYASFALLIAIFFSAVLAPLAQGHARARDRAVFDFERVGGLADTPVQAPAPHDTMAITATIPYLSQYGTGEAYVYLSDAHSVLTNPVVVVEGFDINNDMNWDELYELLNQESLLETLRSVGFDAVVLNFTESTDYLQKNAYVVVELLQQVQAAIAPDMDIVLTGASMGGLVSRYALAYMETNGPAHRVRTFISFDAPHKGANITLGIQYWLGFFAGLSPAAAYNLERLDTPAARQMLVYHHTDTPDLFFDIAGAGDLLSQTPFDVVYYPVANQEHGTITAESKEWFLSEVKRTSTGAPTGKPDAAGVVLHQNVPNPFNPSTSIGFTMREDGDVTLAVYDAAGRRVVTLFDGPASAGTSRVEWNGADGHGKRVSSGVYFCRLESGGHVYTRKLVMLK